MSKSIDKTKNILIIVLFLIITLLYICNGPKPCSDPKVVYKEIIKTKTDTIWSEPKLHTFKSYKPKAKDSIEIKSDTNINYEICKFKRFYQDSLVDSNLTIFSFDTVQGVLLSKGISYKPKKKPETIITTITITKIPEFKKRNKLFIGGEIGGNQITFNFSPKISLLSKKENLYSIRYGLLDKTYNLGFQVKLGKK